VYDPGECGAADVANRRLSAATAAVYGIAEAAILAAGCAPAIGFRHTGKPQSFVYDIADILKFDTTARARAMWRWSAGARSPWRCTTSYQRPEILTRDQVSPPLV
jgi:hypothetical protein